MRLEQKATIVAMGTAFLLAISKFFIGIFTGSIAILSSAIDSLLDMTISFFNTLAIHNAGKNPDEKFNYGRGKIEALAAFLEGIIITASAVFIFYESIRKLITQERVADFSWGIGIMIFSVIITSALVIFLNIISKKTKNLVIQSDALHYKTDLYSNIAILIGLLTMYFFDIFWIDAILGLGIACYISYSAFSIIKQWFLLLLDIALEKDEVEKIQEIIKNHSEVSDFHEFRSRSSGGIKFIEAHLVFTPKTLLIDAHDISHQIEDEIREIDTKSKWSILFHLDPFNDEKEDIKNFQK